MGYFPERLQIECIPAKEDRFRFKVTKDFEYIAGKDIHIVVPVGFKTDFASVPWFFRRIIPATGRYNEATVIHDWLCTVANNSNHYKREYADQVFLECMEALGVKKWKRGLMYRGVSLYTRFKRKK